ncbi:MAG: signal recognition particle receptor subunit alpha [Candidatus Micrarchaeota archaeon]|nr:signal recognition particle receptor subunit alpha [Candidatus Micrarchaeota archaeon]
MLAERLRALVKKLMGKKLLDEKEVEELIKELQRILIASDVNVKLVFELSQNLRKKAIEKEVIKQIDAREQLIKLIYDELISIIGQKEVFEISKNMRIMLVGLYGSGKTTTCAKLAKFIKDRGYSVAIIAGDFDRPAAMDQLQQLSKEINVSFYSARNRDELIDKINTIKEDVLILDTSGRNALDEELINELKYYSERYKPSINFLVISADIGQVAEKQIQAFHSAVGINGIIITRIDGSGKAGGAISACKICNAKIYFVGTGEKIKDFEVFDPNKYISRILGFPDLETLLKKFEEIVKEEQIEVSEQDIKNLDFDVFLKQLKAAKKMGPLSNVLGMLGINDLPEDLVVKQEEELKKIEAIIQSMTKDERKNPDLLKNRSRILRIAKGSGTKEEDVRGLISKFKKAEKMAKMFSNDKNMQKKFQQMFKGIKF